VITNKLTFDPLTHLPELTQNLIRSSHGHSTPSLKISCKSVQPFFRADKERKKERNRPKTIPRPPYGDGVIIVVLTFFTSALIIIIIITKNKSEEEEESNE